MTQKRYQAVLAMGVCLVMLVTSMGAQQHVLDPDALDALVADRLADEDGQRAAVRRVLAHPEVARVAEQAGIDLTRVRDGVSMLETGELADVAARAQQVDTALSGGQSTITFSTTTVIIVLLITILIIVAVN